MKKLFIAIFILTLFTIPLIAVLETENNDIPPLANVVPVGSYVDDQVGMIPVDVDVDWYTYHVNVGNPILVTIMFATFPPALFVDVCTDNPFVVQATLNLITWPSVMFIAQNGNMHYIKVYSTVDNNNYVVRLQNLQDPTLPVVLSSFTADYNSGFVGIQWTTQSETELSGYNVLRNEACDMATASQVNFGIIPSTNTSNVQNYSYQDQEIESNVTYYYWLQAVNMDGTMEHYGPVTVNTNDIGGNTTPEIVQFTGMDTAYPNPFGEETNLKIRLNANMNVKLDIYDIKGQKIRSIFAGELDKGIHRYKWDGKNIHGSTVSSGIYLSRLTTPTGVYSTKLHFVK